VAYGQCRWEAPEYVHTRSGKDCAGLETPQTPARLVRGTPGDPGDTTDSAVRASFEGYAFASFVKVEQSAAQAIANMSSSDKATVTGMADLTYANLVSKIRLGLGTAAARRRGRGGIAEAGEEGRGRWQRRGTFSCTFGSAPRPDGALVLTRSGLAASPSAPLAPRAPPGSASRPTSVYVRHKSVNATASVRLFPVPPASPHARPPQVALAA